MVLVMLCSETQADLGLPPVKLWGEWGYDYRFEQFDEGDNLQEHAGLLKLNALSYIYQPWLAVVEGGLGLQFRDSERDSGDSTGESLFGEARLRLFPRSRFPFEIYGEHADSRTDTDLAGLDLERTRYGMLQRYTTESGSGYRFRYEHTDISNDTLGTDGAEDIQRDRIDQFQAGYTTAFGAHNINFDSSLNLVDRLDRQDSTDTFFSTLRHSYTPGAAFSAEDMLTYNVTDQVRNDADLKTSILQLNSVAFWRPPTRRPLRLNATFRALGRNNESDGAESSAESATSTLGATYELSDRWLLSGSAGVSATETEDQQQVSSFQAASAAYTSDEYKLAGLDASWFGQGDFRNNTNVDGAIQSAGAQIGYSLGKSLIRSDTSWIRFSGSQSAGYLFDSEDFSAQTLLTNLSLSWNRRGLVRSSLIRLSASDSRSYAGGERADEFEGEFQLVNLQASLDQRLSNTATLSGNATIQATRDYKPSITADTGSTNGDWRPTAMVDISYFNSQVFGVPRLTFRSTLRFVSDSYLPLFDNPDLDDGRDDKRWDNRLEYTIGRLQVRAIGRLADIRDNGQAIFLLQVRRLFGDN